jgi:serine/threonine protein kinase
MKQALYSRRPVINNRYHVLDSLGSGGMARVYLAHDEVLDRDIALKVLRHSFASDEEFIERFRREARIAAALSHPNIASVYDLGQTQDGSHYMAMEYVLGVTLRDLIRSKGPLTPRKAIEIATQAAKALKTAHAYGVVHRDIKPQNILLTEEQEVKVVDFGIARAAALSDITQEGHVLGTEHYMSPEQARGAPVGPQSDLYSLGVVLYEMLTGKLPHKAYGSLLGSATVGKRLSRYPHPPKEIAPLIPEKLSDITVRLLSEDPKHRHPDASSLIADLEKVKRKPLESVAMGALSLAFQKGRALGSATTMVLNSAAQQAQTAYKSNKTRQTKRYVPLAPIPLPHRPGRNKSARGQRQGILPRFLLVMLILAAVLVWQNLVDLSSAEARLSGEVERKLGEGVGKIEHNIDKGLENGLDTVESKVVDGINSILMPSLEDQQGYQTPYNFPNDPGGDSPQRSENPLDKGPGGSPLPAQSAPAPQSPSPPHNPLPGSPSYPSNRPGDSLLPGSYTPYPSNPCNNCNGTIPRQDSYEQSRQGVEKQIDENLQNLERMFGP